MKNAFEKPYVVLAKWEPTVWKSWKIGPALCAITKNHGLVPHVDPAHPAQDWVPWVDEELHAEVRIWTVGNPAGAGWHQDGDTTPGSNMDCGIVLWADCYPTEFLFNGTIYQPHPYELVIVRNLACLHRRPPHLRQDFQRWVFRQRVKTPPKSFGLP